MGLVECCVVDSSFSLYQLVVRGLLARQHKVGDLSYDPSRVDLLILGVHPDIGLNQLVVRKSENLTNVSVVQVTLKYGYLVRSELPEGLEEGDGMGTMSHNSNVLYPQVIVSILTGLLLLLELLSLKGVEIDELNFHTAQQQRQDPRNAKGS